METNFAVKFDLGLSRMEIFETEKFIKCRFDERDKLKDCTESICDLNYVTACHIICVTFIIVQSNLN